MDSAASPPRDRTDGSGIDWERAEHSSEFQELVHARRRFVVPATIFFLAWYFGFILLAGYAEDFMGDSIYQGFTVGYALALTQFVMVWVLGALYLRRADRTFDPLARKAAEKAIAAGPSNQQARSGGDVPPAGASPSAGEGSAR